MQTPATASIRAARTARDGAAENRTCPPVPRISCSAAMLASAESGISHAASSRLNVELTREYATAAGTATTPTTPRATASDGDDALLLRVRAANSCGWDRA